MNGPSPRASSLHIPGRPPAATRIIGLGLWGAHPEASSGALRDDDRDKAFRARQADWLRALVSLGGRHRAISAHPSTLHYRSGCRCSRLPVKGNKLGAATEQEIPDQPSQRVTISRPRPTARASG